MVLSYIQRFLRSIWTTSLPSFTLFSRTKPSATESPFLAPLSPYGTSPEKQRRPKNDSSKIEKRENASKSPSSRRTRLDSNPSTASDCSSSEELELCETAVCEMELSEMELPAMRGDVAARPIPVGDEVKFGNSTAAKSRRPPDSFLSSDDCGLRCFTSRISDVTISSDEWFVDSQSRRGRAVNRLTNLFRRARNSKKWATCAVCRKKRKWRTLRVWINILAKHGWRDTIEARRLRKCSMCRHCKAVDHQVEYYRRRLIISTIGPGHGNQLKVHRRSKQWTRATTKVLVKLFKSKIFKDLVVDAVIKAMEKSVKR